MRKKKEKSTRESRRRCIMYVVWCNPGQEKNNITQKKIFGILNNEFFTTQPFTKNKDTKMKKIKLKQ